VRPVDIHAHYFPQAYLDVLPEGPRFTWNIRGGGRFFNIKDGDTLQGPLPYRAVDLKKRIADLDAQGTACRRVAHRTHGALGRRRNLHKTSARMNDAASAR